MLERSISSASCSSARRRVVALRGIGDPGARADQDQTLHTIARGKRHVQGDPPAHRVPDQRVALRPGRRHDIVDHRLQRDRDALRRVAVAADVVCD